MIPGDFESRYGMHTARAKDVVGPIKEEDDLAEAWIRGDHERVWAAIADHEARVRSRIVIVKPVCKKTRIIELRKRGWSTRNIATELNTTTTYVARVCLQAGLSRPSPKHSRRAERARKRVARAAAREAQAKPLREMRAMGMTLSQISKQTGMDIARIWRLTSMRDAPSSATC